MLARTILVKMLVGSLLMCGGWALVELTGGPDQLYAQTKDQKEENPLAGKKGKTTGALVAKGENYIEVKADGEEKARRYVPKWIGGLPADGGGFDKGMLKVFSQLKVGSRVEVEWEHDGERFRAVKVTVLKKNNGK